VVRGSDKEEGVGRGGEGGDWVEWVGLYRLVGQLLDLLGVLEQKTVS